MLLIAGCKGDNSVRQLPHLGNTPYQQDTILVTYATNPERALTLLDSALLLGNISDYRSQVIRAKIFSKSLVEQQLDYAIILRSRAIAARDKGNFAEALGYQTRYADLSKAVSDSLHRSEAHDYAARYHAYEQQLEIQEKEAEAERSHIVALPWLSSPCWPLASPSISSTRSASSMRRTEAWYA